MSYYIVSVNEYATKNIAIEADSATEAEQIADDLYSSGEIDMSNYDSVDFDIEHEGLSEEEAKSYSDLVFPRKLGMKLGLVVCTAGIISAKDNDASFAQEINKCFERYQKKDWGNLCDDDKELNDTADERKDRILAMYKTSKGKIYIITEWDKSVTTILFASEY